MQLQFVHGRIVLSTLLAALSLAWAAPPVEAANPERVFRGEVITSAKRLPTQAKSSGAYIKKLKKARTKRFVEDKAKRSWKIHYAAFFRQPLNDLEVTVKLYDISDGRQHLITSFQQYVDERGQGSLIGHVTLERQFFGVNKQILMIFESRGSRLAMGKFFIVGEGEKHSGSADFTADE